MSKRRHYLASAVTISTFAVTFTAAAQTVPTNTADQGPKPGTSKAPEEVIVTAQKRPSRERKTPISMEVYSAASIAEKGITDIQSLATLDSTVNFEPGGGEAHIAIRGISTQTNNEVSDPSVPVSTDGFFLNRPYTYNESLYDLSRIEVLRGPQGTLYGRNATGGVINVITNDPTKTFGGYEEVSYGNYNSLNTNGALNVPLSDTLQARISYSTLNHDGYRTISSYYAPGTTLGHADTQDSKSARIKVAWEPTADIKAVITGQYTSVGGSGAGDTLTPIRGGTGSNYDENQTYKNSGVNPFNFPLETLPTLSITEKALRWNIQDTALPYGITATYLGGYDVLSWERVTPQCSPSQSACGFSSPPNETFSFDQTEKPKTQNQEFRLTSSPNQRLIWQAGFFYFKEVNVLGSEFWYNFQQPGQTPFLYFPFTVNTTSKAVYGQATYKLTSQVNLTGGLRWTDDHKDRTGTSTIYFPFGDFSGVDNDHHTFDKLTWHGGVDYNPNSDLLIYGKADKGYKSGGFTGESPPFPPDYAPEQVLAYEVGAKDRLPGSGIVLSGDVFYQRYSNQQVSVFVPVNTSGGGFVTNVKRSNIYGADIGAHGALGTLLGFDLNATYLHARFGGGTELGETVNNLGGTAGNQETDVSGEQLQQSPNLTLTAGVEHTFNAFRGGITARIETKYQSGEYLQLFNQPWSYVSSHQESNAYLRYDDDAGRFLVEVYVRNLTNAIVLTDSAQQGLGSNGAYYNFGFDPPRTYGFRVRGNF